MIASSVYFMVSDCGDPTRIGTNCDVSNTLCDMLKPCKNNATCNNKNDDYECICLLGFDGKQCQFDRRPCKPNTCWNDGLFYLSILKLKSEYMFLFLYRNM